MKIKKNGDSVRVPHKGKMIKGKVVRYDKGDPGGTPYYVVMVPGEAASIKVPIHKIQENTDIIDKINECLESFDEEDLICEVRYKKVIRKGKIIRKPICPDGFKFAGGKCVKMKNTEKIKRSRSTKKAQRKVQNSGAKAKLIRKRAKSMRKRKALIPNALTFTKVKVAKGKETKAEK